MTIRMIIATGALLASTSAWAQAAPGTEQTSEDLVCQLSEKCSEAAPSPGDQVEAAAAAGPANRATPRVSATRGFKIARKVDAPAASASTGYTAARPAPSAGKAQSRVAYDSGKKASTPVAGKSRATTSANAMVMPKGRADLRVTFVTGSAELTESGQREAQKFASALSSPLLQGMRFTIEGHTDAVGSRAANQDLSRRRSAAVVDYLVGKGADRSRFDTVGYGSDRPLDGISPTAALNRRVEVVRNK